MKKSKLITILAVAVLIASLVGSLFLSSDLGARIANIITILTAVIGAIALFIQFKKDKELNQANFVMEFSKSFFNDYNCGELFAELDKHYNEDDGYVFDINKWHEEYAKYILWIESISAVVLDDILDIKKVDKALGYRFFILVNNPVVQKEEIIPYSNLYKGTYLLYEKWYNYRKKNKIAIPNEEFSLSKTINYQQTIATKYENKKTTK